MSAPFLYYKELSPSSAVRLSTFFTPIANRKANLTSDHTIGNNQHGGNLNKRNICKDFEGAEYLFVAAQAAVSIYQVHRLVNHCSEKALDNDQGSSRSNNPFLSLVYHSPLFGTVRDVQVYTHLSSASHSTADYHSTANHLVQDLVVSLDDGKYCVAHYEPEAAELKIISMFNAQEGAMGIGAVIKGSAHGQQTAGSMKGPYVTCDDGHALACSALYASQLYFFPLGDGQSVDAESGLGDLSTLRTPFLIDFFMRNDLAGDIVDVVFLPGAAKPTLVVLQEKAFLPLGHAKVRMHTFVITAFSVDATRKTLSRLWQHDSLPHNSIRLLTLPGHPRGNSSVLLVTMNAVLLISAERVLGQATNGFAAITVTPAVFLQTWPYTIGVELDAAQWTNVLSVEGMLLASLKDGKLMTLRLVDTTPNVEDPVSVRMIPQILCQTTKCGAIAASPMGDLWWLGSGGAWSSLILVQKQSAAAMVAVSSELNAAASLLGGVGVQIDSSGQAHAVLPTADQHNSASTKSEKGITEGEDEQPAKKIKREPKSTSEAGFGHDDITAKATRKVSKPTDVIEEEERALYGKDLASLAWLQAKDNVVATGETNLMVVDTVNVLGPILGGTFCRTDDSFDRGQSYLDWKKMGTARGKAVPESAASYISEREIKDGLQLNAGLDDQSSLVRASQGQRYTKIAARTMPGVTDVLSFSPRGTSNTITLLQGSRPRLLIQTSIEASETNNKIANINQTQTTATTGAADAVAAVVQVTEVPLESFGLSTEQTIAMGEIAPGFMVQVTPTAVRLIALHAASDNDASKASSETAFGSGVFSESVLFFEQNQKQAGGEAIKSADIASGMVAAVDTAGNIHVLTISTTKSKTKLLKLPGAELRALIPSTCTPVGISIYVGLFAHTTHSVKPSRQRLTPNTTHPHALGAGGTSSPRRPQATGTPSSAHKGSSGTSNTSGQIQRESLEEQFLYGQDLSDKHQAAHVASSATVLTRERTDSIADSVADSIAESDAESVTGRGRESKATKAKKGTKTKETKKTKKQLNEEQEALRVSAASQISSADSQASIKNISSLGQTPAAQVESFVQYSPSQYVAVWCAQGEVAVIDVDAKKLVFWNQEIGMMPQAISVQRFYEEDLSSDIHTSLTQPSAVSAHTPAKTTVASNRSLFHSSNFIPTDIAATRNRGVHSVRIASLGGANTPPALQRLCIIALLGTCDLVCYVLAGPNDGRLRVNSDIYQGDNGSGSGTDRMFVKLQHSCITRRRRAANVVAPGVKPNANSTAAAGQSGASASTANSNNIRTAATPAVYESAINYRLSVSELNGKIAIIVSGSNPVLIQCEQGAVRVLPLCLPEVQYANPGTMLVTPLIAGTIRGLLTLWQEPERKPTFGAARPALVQQDVAILALYQESPGTFLLPGSDLSLRRLVVSKTIKASVEFTDRGDDKTEQELLSRRTFLLALSEEVHVPFVKNVLTEATRLEQLKLYDRYFQNLSSWCNPDINIGAPALRATRRDELVLMQGGEPVSSYRLPEGEVITGAEIVCLSTEKAALQLNIGMGRAPAHAAGGKRRVFVVCGTCKLDSHGEDTPGEGRLLLFSLDYSVYQEDGMAKGPDESDISDSATSSMAIESDPKIARDAADAQGDSSQSNQSNKTQGKPAEGGTSAFAAMIQPKLRLEWTGPGASSIVQGFGEFVLATVDSMLYVYKLLPGTMELEQVAFWRANIYIKSVSIIKERFFAVVDFLHSVQFLVWNQADYSITVLGKDFAHTVGLTTSFVRDGSTLGILLGDAESNLQLLQYAPSKSESREGSRLLAAADFHVGSDPNILLSHPMVSLVGPATGPMHAQGSLRPPLSTLRPAVPAAADSANMGFGVRMSKASNKDVIIIGTTAGAVGLLVPLDEKIYRRLALLQQLMVTVVPTVFGLNPIEYRRMRHKSFRAECKHGILDGALLQQFISMECQLQDELSSAMGIDTHLLMETLRDITTSGSVF